MDVLSSGLLRSQRSSIALSAALLALTGGQTTAAAEIVSERFSGMCVDIEGVSTTDGASAIQYPCVGQANQNFSVEPVGDAFRIRAAHSGQCLAVAGGSAEQGAAVIQSACTDTPDKLWRIDGQGAEQRLRVTHTGMCLNIRGASRSATAPLIQWPCVGADNEVWRILGSGQGQSPSSWAGPYPMPLVPAAAANLPDGNILTWSAYAKLNFGAESGFTATAVFDPNTGISTEALVSNTGHDMFCPGTATLADGRLMVTGGSNSEVTSIYDPVSGSWTQGPSMRIPRGYHSMTVLADGSVFTIGGSWSGGVAFKDGEVWNPDTGWQLKGNIFVDPLVTDDPAGLYRSDNHMWLFTAPNGMVFHAGPARSMHWLDTNGDGRVIPSALRGDDADAMNGNAVMFDIGKILTVGGAPDYDQSDASRRAYVIDVNGGVDNVQVNRVGDMAFERALHGSVVLPSGEVVVVGGQTRAILFSDEGAVLTPELWDPATGEFSTLAPMQVPRTYHSVALLLRDGRVFAAGGGLCGSCSTNHPDAEILTPPYLLNADGSPAVRPSILSAPAGMAPGDRIQVTMDSAGPHSFALVRTSAATHAVNNDQRRIPLTVVGSSNGRFDLTVPANPAIVLPGDYFLFAMNASGTPSIANVVRVNQTGTVSPTVVAIRSERLSDQCVDIAGNSTGENAPAIQWPCHNRDNQRFELEPVDSAYRLRAQHSGKCLGVENGATTREALVVQATCADRPEQLWQLSGSGADRKLRVQHTGMCLNIQYASTERGAALIQWPCVDAANELWRLDPR